MVMVEGTKKLQETRKVQELVRLKEANFTIQLHIHEFYQAREQKLY